MRSLELLSTIKWIQNAFTNETRDALFGYGLFKSGPEVEPSAVLIATHELVRSTTVIRTNPDAVRVLEAFGLSFMLQHGYPTELAGTLLARIFNLMFDIPTFQRPSASLFIGARAR